VYRKREEDEADVPTWICCDYCDRWCHFECELRRAPAEILSREAPRDDSHPRDGSDHHQDANDALGDAVIGRDLDPDEVHRLARSVDAKSGSASRSGSACGADPVSERRVEDALVGRRYRCPDCRAVDHPLGAPRPLAAAATQTSMAAGAHVRRGRVVHRRPFLRGADRRVGNFGTPAAAADAAGSRARSDAGAGTTRGYPRGATSSAFETPSAATGTKRARSAPRSARRTRARGRRNDPGAAPGASSAPAPAPAPAEFIIAESEDELRAALCVPSAPRAPVDWTLARRRGSASRAAAVEAAAAAAAEAELRRDARALLPDDALARHLADGFDVDSPPELSPPRPPEAYFDIPGTRAGVGRTSASSLFIEEAAPSPVTPGGPPGSAFDPRRRGWDPAAAAAAAAVVGNIAATAAAAREHQHGHEQQHEQPRVSNAGAGGCTRGGMGSPTGLRLLRRATVSGEAREAVDARVSPSSIFTAAKLSGGANANANANPTTPHARGDDPEREAPRAGAPVEPPTICDGVEDEEEEDVLLFDADAWLTGRGRFGAGLLEEEEVAGVGWIV
jgi:hypothetical protein